MPTPACPTSPTPGGGWPGWRADDWPIKVISFKMDYQAADRMIGHLKLTFVAD
jgi:hypothetical protein